MTGVIAVGQVRRSRSTAASEGDPRRRISALFRRRDGAAARRHRAPARRDWARPSGLLRRQPLRLRGAVADRLAGDRRSGRRLHARPARRLVRAARQSRAAGAAACGAGRSRMGRRLVDRRRDRRAGASRGARRPCRRNRPDDVSSSTKSLRRGSARRQISTAAIRGCARSSPPRSSIGCASAPP